LNLELSGTSTSDLISVSNTLTTSGTTTVNLTALSGFGAGTYPLITGTATISSSKFSLGTVPSGYGGVLSASNGMLSVTLIALPATPTALAATTRSSSVLLSWNAASGANTYNVFRSLTSGAGYSLVGSPSLTNFTDSAVTNGTTYYYVINASNAGGSSPYSVEVATTPSLLITTAEITSVTLSNSANPETLSIPASVLGHTYQLQYRDDLTSGSWSNTGSPQLGTGGSLQFGITPTTGVPKRFYRILIQRL